MLIAHLKLQTPTGLCTLEAELWNVSGLAASSSYDFAIEDRRKPAELRLTKYPRWCESTRGLLARCIALTDPSPDAAPLQDWTTLQVDIGIQPGGRGALRPLAMACATRQDDGRLDVGFREAEGLVGHLSACAQRAAYRDAWDLAEHALRLTMFERDELPPAKALELPVYKSGTLPYVRTGDIPEPTRSVFEKRMAHSTRPVIAGAADAVYAWDWTDFLGGQR